MKKALIAGAASVALAAMPVVGVFAADITTVTDTLQITVDAACSINSVTATTGNDDTTYTATVENGGTATFNHDSQHVFNVVCNNNAGWSVTASAPQDLSGTSGNLHEISYQASALPASATEGAWTATVSGTGVPATAEGNGIADASGHIKTAGGVIATQSVATAGSSFTVSYAAYVGTETAADTYTGTIGYTLATL